MSARLVSLVLGLHSPLTEWCSAVLHKLLANSLSTCRELQVSSAEELIRELLCHEGPAVVRVPRPGRVLREAITGSGLPYVLSTASPATSVQFVSQRTGTRPIDNVREVLDATAALSALPRSELGLRIGEEALTARGPASVLRIAGHLSMACSDSLAEDIDNRVRAESTARNFERPATSATDQVGSGSEREETLAVEAAVTGLASLLSDGQRGRVVATRRLFTVTDTGASPVGPIDATGRRRLLVHGPYLSLPPGDWTARCVYGFSAGMVGTQLSTDVSHVLGGPHELARTTFNVTAPGRLDVNIRFVHADPAARLEVRLFCDRTIFDGQVSVGLVEFTPSAPEPIGSGDLEEMLTTAI